MTSTTTGHRFYTNRGVPSFTPLLFLLISSFFGRYVNGIESPLLEIDFSAYTDDVGAPFNLHGGAQITTPTGESFSALRVTSEATHAIIPNMDISPSQMPYCTLMITVKLVSIANDRGWVLTQDDGGYDRSIMMHDNRFSSPKAIASAVGYPTWNPWFSPQTPQIGVWYHVTAVFQPNGQQCSLWVNGVQADRTTMCNNGDGHDYLIVGSLASLTPHYADSWIRKVSVFNKALDSTSIAYYAANSLTPPVPLQTTYSYTASQSAAKFDWNITLTDPLDIIKPTTEQGIYKMITKYILDDHHYKVSIYKKDCLNKPTPEDAIPLVVADIDNDINTNNENNIELMLLYNQTSVETSDLWTANKTGGYSEFCIKVRNFLEEDGDPLAREIHFLEVKYKIEVDSLTDFNETITVDRIDATDGGVEEINYEEEIEVFQCEDDFSEITSTVPLTQGDFLQLCVTTVSGSKFGVHSIKELDVSQQDSTPSLYPYIDGFIDSPLAESACDTTVANTSAAVCKAKMQLLSAYFDSTEPDALFANGTVKLDYVGRRLSVDVPVSLRYDGGGAVTAEEAVAAAGRNLAEGDEGPSFGIEVGLSGDDGSANDASLSLLSMGGLFSAGMAFLVAGMV